MAKYETMVVIDGSLKETEIKKTITDLKSIIKNAKNIETNELGIKDLAYEINKKKTGFYVVFNYETEDKTLISEFRRLIFLNKNVIRSLIINIEKEYGYKATVNPKKVAKSNYRAETYKQVKEKIEKNKEEQLQKEKDTTSVKVTDVITN